MPYRANVNDNITLVNSIAIGTLAASANGTSMNTQTLTRQGMRFLCVHQCGTLTDGGYTAKVQDSADDSSFADIAPFDGAFVEVTTANDPLTQMVSVVPVVGRPYLRMVITESTAGVAGGSQCAYIMAIPANL